MDPRVFPGTPYILARHLRDLRRVDWRGFQRTQASVTEIQACSQILVQKTRENLFTSEVCSSLRSRNAPGEQVLSARNRRLGRTNSLFSSEGWRSKLRVFIYKLISIRWDTPANYMNILPCCQELEVSCKQIEKKAQ